MLSNVFLNLDIESVIKVLKKKKTQMTSVYGVTSPTLTSESIKTHCLNVTTMCTNYTWLNI